MAFETRFGAVCFQEYSKGYLDFIELAAESGLTWVEFKYESPLRNHRNSLKYRKVKMLADSLGIGLSMHTAFDGLNIASIEHDERNMSLNAVKKSIDAASRMDISLATVHAGFLPSSDYSAKNWEDSIRHNIDSLRELVTYAEKLNITLCLENGNAYHRNSLKHGIHPGDLKYIRKGVGDRLMYTVDFGHALFLGSDPALLISELGSDKIKLSHLHSNDGMKDSHCPLGSGVLQLRQLLSMSVTEEWDFPLSIEMKSEEDLRQSVKVIRKIMREQKGL